MKVFRPESQYSALKVVYLLIDFLIEQIKQGQVEVAPFGNQNFTPLGFNIWLIKSPSIENELRISLSYENSGGIYVGEITPIERFRFELIHCVTAPLEMRSRDPNSYDKMLELFMACLDAIKGKDPHGYERILNTAASLSTPMSRNRWRRSRKTIETEMRQNFDLKKASDDLERLRKSKLAELTSRYESQGFEITD